MPRDMNSDPGGQSLSDMSFAKSTSDSTQEDSASFGEQVRSQGSASVDQVSGTASRLTRKARKRVARYAEGYKGTVTQQIDAVAQAIRKAGEELGHNEQAQASRLADQAAGGLESLSRTIQDADLNDVLNSVRRFGRSNPTVFVGGALLAGMALARFARASSQPQPQSQGGQSWQGGAMSGGSQRSGLPDAQRKGQGSFSGSTFAGGGGTGAAGSFRAGGAASYGASGATGGGGLGTAAAAAGGPGGFGSQAGSSGRGGQGSFTPSGGSSTGAPGSAQGYAGGGMGTDPIQSSAAGSGRTSSPSSAAEPSVGGSSSPGGLPSGAISTGEGS